ncbi:MAG: hypothetical protein RMJ98_21780 [Myxococcales bacterium]|nr:hypothetical protein [Polyangiaceae bacterium]MDW8251935.1 hypothetical protein [Myxococcales bacterium]
MTDAKQAGLLAVLLMGVLHGGCGPVVAPAEEEAAGAGGQAPKPDLCQRPGAPDFCREPLALGRSLTCTGGQPDGQCTPDLEDCSCTDCVEVARCKERCIDDMVCDRQGGEDCSCADCSGKVEGCAPSPVGCVDNGVCSPLEDDCICADCREDEHCQSCMENGYCVEFLEGCSCGDCSDLAGCKL